MAGRAAALIALTLGAAPGCGYLTARGRDLSDVISPGVSVGGGIGVRASATRLVAVEVIAQKDERMMGWHTRNTRWTESAHGFPFAMFWRPPAIEDEPIEERHWYDAFTTSRRVARYPNLADREDRRHTLFIYSGGHALRWIDFLDVEVGLSALAGGIEMGIRPGELLDFLLGWFGLDIAGDDGLRDVPVEVKPTQAQA